MTQVHFFNTIDGITGLTTINEASAALSDSIILWDTTAGLFKVMTLEDLQDEIDTTASGGAGEAFKTISVSGQSDVVADAAADTLTLVAAGGMTITTTAGTDTITLSSADTNTQLSTEAVQDIVGAMFSGNTETRGSLTYQDADGTIDLVVDDMTADTNTQLSNEQVQDIVGAMFTSNTETRISATYQDGDGTIDLVVDDMTADTNTQLSNEQVQDIVGAMFTGNTETNITATYQDGDGTIDLVASDTNTTYSAGDLLDLSTTTFNVDLSELTDGTGAINKTQDEIVYLDNGSQKRKLVSEWDLSAFNNDSGFTTNAGDITEVTAGDGMTGGGASGAVTLNVVGGTGITANANDIALSSGAALTNLGGGSGTTFLRKDGTWATPSGGSSTDSFLIFGEESDDYLSSTGSAGNANGFAFSYGNGAQNTTKSSTGVDFGMPVGCDCTLKAVYVHMGNKNSDTSTGTIIFDVFKNETQENDTFSGDGSGSSGNAFLISKTDYDIDFSAGDRFNLRVEGPSGWGARVGPSRMVAYFERQ